MPEQNNEREKIGKNIFYYVIKKQPTNCKGQKVKGWKYQKDFWQECWKIIADWHISELNSAVLKARIEELQWSLGANMDKDSAIAINNRIKELQENLK